MTTLCQTGMLEKKGGSCHAVPVQRPAGAHEIHYPLEPDALHPGRISQRAHLRYRPAGPHALPDCTAVLTAGQLATNVFSEHFGIKEKPEMGGFVEFEFENRKFRLYRMPSSSRAYPMAVEKKAEYYRKMFNDILEK